MYCRLQGSSVYRRLGLALLIVAGAGQRGFAAASTVPSAKATVALRSMFTALPVELRPRVHEFLRPNSPLGDFARYPQNFAIHDDSIVTADEIRVEDLARPDHAAELFSRLGILERAFVRMGKVDLKPLQSARAALVERMSQNRRDEIEDEISQVTAAWGATNTGSVIPIPASQERQLALHLALVGKDPVSMLFRNVRNFPQIDSASIENMKVIGARNAGDPLHGLGTIKRFVGTFNGEKVFIKLSRRPLMFRMNEATWLKALHYLSVKVARFHSLTKIDGNLGTVIKYIDGAHLTSPRWEGTSEWKTMKKMFERRPDFAITDMMEQDIRHAYSVIEGELNLSPVDLNFRLGTDGHAYLLDPEFLNLPPSDDFLPVDLEMSLSDLAAMRKMWLDVSWARGQKPPHKP